MDNLKHETTGTIHARGEYDTPKCGRDIGSFHNPYRDTKEKVTCKICKKMD
jgi:hypothetical protein